MEGLNKTLGSIKGVFSGVLKQCRTTLKGVYDELTYLYKRLIYGLIGGSEDGLPIKIYNQLNKKVLEMEQLGKKPILILGDDTDSYLSCYLYNLLRDYDGLEPLTVGGVLKYKGTDKGLYVDASLNPKEIGWVFMDTDVSLPLFSVSLSNHVNLMSDDRIININNYLHSNNRKWYRSKYPFGTTQLLLGVCKVKGIQIPSNIYDYFLRCDMSKLPKSVFMGNVIYHSSVLGLKQEFKNHREMVKCKGIKSNWKLFKDVTVEQGKLDFIEFNYSVVKALLDWNRPHKDVRLTDLRKVYTLDTVPFTVEGEGELVGCVDGLTYTIYTHRNKYYYTRLQEVRH